YMDILLVSGRVEMRTFGKAKIYYQSQRLPVSSILNVSSEMVIVIDKNLKIIQANKSILSFLSTTQDKLIGSYIYKGPAKIFFSDLVADQIHQIKSDNTTIHDEIKIFRNNQEYYIEQRVYPTVLATGQPGYTIINDDITDRVCAERALKSSEEMFRQLVETVQDCIWSVDENSVIKYISPQIEDISGYTPDELIGKRFTDFMPEGAGKRFSWELSAELSRNSGFNILDFPFICKNKNRIYCEFSGTPVVLNESSGIFLGYHGALRDVTNRMNAEHGEKQWKLFLDTIMDNLPSMIFVSDATKNSVVYANVTIAKFLNMRYEDILKISSTDLIHKFKSDIMDTTYNKVKETNEPINNSVDNVNINGSKYNILFQILPVTLYTDYHYILTIITTKKQK
ncbi:MAG TPA: PAS domain S-box protein, partial [Methanocorpusculum sp.]|nr:PAS domain S-box protein [Methanocorpusculum sp.]